MAYLNLERVINCSVTEQIVADNIARVTSAWKAPETCGARVVVCRSNVILAQALRSMASELFDADGVPLQKLMSQMHPFEDDGSSPGSFPDRLTLDLLPFMSAPGVILDSCDTILNHISTSFHEMGLDCVPPQEVYPNCALYHRSSWRTPKFRCLGTTETGPPRLCL